MHGRTTLIAPLTPAKTPSPDPAAPQTARSRCRAILPLQLAVDHQMRMAVDLRPDEVFDGSHALRRVALQAFRHRPIAVIDRRRNGRENPDIRAVRYQSQIH